MNVQYHLCRQVTANESIRSQHCAQSLRSRTIKMGCKKHIILGYVTHQFGKRAQPEAVIWGVAV